MPSMNGYINGHVGHHLIKVLLFNEQPLKKATLVSQLNMALVY